MSADDDAACRTRAGPTRRAVLLGAGLGAGAFAAACAGPRAAPARVIGPYDPLVRAAEARRLARGTGRVVTARLTAAPGVADLGGRTAATWLYGDRLPGPPLRARAGDELDVTFLNRLPEAGSIHWHGIALRGDMDGVPGLTQPMVDSGGTFRYRFTVPDPGTYWAHSHSGTQLDRGLYLPLIVDAADDPGRYDAEHVVMFDDWLDGLGSTPDAVLAALTGGHPVPMPGMDPTAAVPAAARARAAPLAVPSFDARSPYGPQLGDVRHPVFLANGRLPTQPVTLAAKPGQRVLLRLINAAADTVFRIRLAGHRLTVVAADGWPVRPVVVDELLLAMGERYDVVVTAGDGRFGLDATAEGKDGAARAVLATAAGTVRPAVPLPAVPLPAARLLAYRDLAPTDAARLPARRPDRELRVTLSSAATGYRWMIDGRTWAQRLPLDVRAGERVRLTVVNDSEMFHPMHLHGHTWALVGAGAGTRKDVTVVAPGATLQVDVQADNPGRWALHCHNLYHGQAGMMTELRYVTGGTVAASAPLGVAGSTGRPGSTGGAAAAAGPIALVGKAGKFWTPDRIVARPGRIELAVTSAGKIHDLVIDGVAGAATGPIYPGLTSHLTVTLKAGTYRFHCTYHRMMTGTLIVR